MHEKNMQKTGLQSTAIAYQQRVAKYEASIESFQNLLAN